LSGTALSNSKSYSDSKFLSFSSNKVNFFVDSSIEEFGPIAASVSIGEMISLLTKETIPTLMIMMIFDLMVCVLSLEVFKETAWISSAVGLN